MAGSQGVSSRAAGDGGVAPPRCCATKLAQSYPSFSQVSSAMSVLTSSSQEGRGGDRTESGEAAGLLSSAGRGGFCHQDD